MLRRYIAFVIDFVLHVGIAFGVYAACDAIADLSALALPAAALAWVTASFVHRVIIQRIFHTTAGKALCGLVMIRPDDGRWPTAGFLVKWWLIGVVVIFIDNMAPTDENGFPPAVRRCDVGALGAR